MAVPRLADPKPFLLLDPERLRESPRRSASIRGAARAGRPVASGEMERVDLVVCGTVACNRRGVRVGKGGGFSDLEFALLVEAGRLDADATLATTVHPLQLLDRRLPETEHDFRVQRIVTPESVIRTGARRRPPGILWDHLDDQKVAAVPALTALRG
jgi:5-formyltetrahydrofolate cyclo-ligase